MQSLDNFILTYFFLLQKMPCTLERPHSRKLYNVQSCFFLLSLQSNLEVLGTLRERQLKLKEDALVLQEEMTEFRNNIVKEVHYNIIIYIVYMYLIHAMSRFEMLFMFHQILLSCFQVDAILAGTSEGNTYLKSMLTASEPLETTLAAS